MAADAAPAALPTMPRAERAVAPAPPPDDCCRRRGEHFRVRSAPSASPRAPPNALEPEVPGFRIVHFCFLVRCQRLKNEPNTLWCERNRVLAGTDCFIFLGSGFVRQP